MELNLPESVVYEKRGPIAIITMNRPERRNAMSPEFTLGLLQAAQRAADDMEVRAVLLKGAGGTFCVGGDVRGFVPPRVADALADRLASTVA